MTRIQIQNVKKAFQIGFNKKQTALSRFISVFSGREPKKRLLALNDISIDIDEGELVGIIGSNGSGKSTLLRCISGIYHTDGGRIRTNGKIVPLINLYWSLQDRLTMRDNIFLCCSLLGLSTSEIKTKFRNICEFAELTQYINTKLYQFSSGMKQRLSFSMGLHARPCIILIDEVFEVGDNHFKKKSFAAMHDLIRKGGSVLVISSDINIIDENCSRVIWLEKGKVRMDGPVREVVKVYQQNGK